MFRYDVVFIDKRVLKKACPGAEPGTSSTKARIIPLDQQATRGWTSFDKGLNLPVKKIGPKWRDARIARACTEAF